MIDVIKELPRRIAPVKTTVKLISTADIMGGSNLVGFPSGPKCAAIFSGIHSNEPNAKAMFAKMVMIKRIRIVFVLFSLVHPTNSGSLASASCWQRSFR